MKLDFENETAEYKKSISELKEGFVTQKSHFLLIIKSIFKHTLD